MQAKQQMEEHLMHLACAVDQFHQKIKQVWVSKLLSITWHG